MQLLFLSVTFAMLAVLPAPGGGRMDIVTVYTY